MTEQILMLILSIAGGIIILLLGAIGYGIKLFVDTGRSLSSSVEKLNEWYVGQEKDLSWVKANCGTITHNTQKELDNHSKQLEEHDIKLYKHDEQIAILKTQAR